MPDLSDKFRGCLLGAMIGDVAGAVVEAESPAYISKTYRSVDQILSTQSVPEFTGPAWQVGRFTDDTQMMLCVAEWLLAGESDFPERLLARFAAAYEPWRRYGPGTASILRMFPEHKADWRELATAMFPHGSHGNGSAMRAAPVGLAYHNDLAKLPTVAMASSRPTHSHSLAYQGAVLQSLAVAMVLTSSELNAQRFLQSMRAALLYFSDLLHDTSKFLGALDEIESGLTRGAACREMSSILGAGIAAHEAVPMAAYCFLRHPDSFERVIHEAVFIGGDTDTIASMAGAISGAFHGHRAIPSKWLELVREEKYGASKVAAIADQLFERFASRGL